MKLNWIGYLNNKFQDVKINNTVSHFRKDPQSSMIGPAKFVLHLKMK